MRSKKPALGFIFVTLLLDVLGFGVIIPVAPKLVQALLENGTEERAAKYVGALAASYAAMQFFFAPLLGALSDRVGRRPVLLFSILGSGLDYIVMALAPNLAVLFITRALNGLTGASMTVANAYIADITPPDKRAAAFGMTGAAFGLGFILGPLAGGILGEIDLRLPFFAAGGFALLNWLFGLIVLPESLPRELRAPLAIKKMNPIGAFAGLWRYPAVAGLAISFFLMNLAMYGLHNTWVLYTSHRYGWSPRDVGLSLFLVGLTSAIVQAGLARKLIPMLGERRSLLWGVLIGAAAYVCYGAATQGWMIYATIIGASIGGIAQPAGQALLTRAVRPDEQGVIQGALTSLQSVAAILGPLIAASLFAYGISERAVLPFNHPGLSFFAGAGFCVVGWLFALRATARSPQTPHSS